MEKEEEDYFNEDSDEEDTSSASNSQKIQPQPGLSNGVASTHTSLSPRPGGLVDYDDDEDDEDYRPPPKKQPENSEEDEGALESLRLKRKLGPKESELAEKKPRLGKCSKPRDSVFAALCSTINQAASKRTANTVKVNSSAADGNKGVDGENIQKKETIGSSSRDGHTDSDNSTEENHREKDTIASRSCSDHLHSTTDGRQLGGEECSLIPPKSSPEMAVNGS
jgi:protein phosphatase-4 regulatory subunit 3